MKTIKNVHNNYFIKEMSHKENAIVFLSHFLPNDVLDKIDLDTLEVVGSDYYDEGLRESHSDVLYRVNIQGTVAFIVALLEHQSRADKWMALRVLKYQLNAAEKVMHTTKTEHLPVIYTMVFYHDADNKPYPYSTNIYELFGPQSALAKELFFKPFQLIDVNKIDDDKLIALKRFGVMAYTMKYSRSQGDIKDYLEALLPELKKLDKDEATRQDIIDLVKYVAEVSNTRDPEDFMHFLAEHLSNETGEDIMTIRTQLIAKGRAEGEARGEARGKAEMAKEVAIRLLQQGMGVDAIAAATSLSVDEIKALKQQNSH